jgi:hypothetical protein
VWKDEVEESESRDATRTLHTLRNIQNHRDYGVIVSKSLLTAAVAPAYD